MDVALVPQAIRQPAPPGGRGRRPDDPGTLTIQDELDFVARFESQASADLDGDGDLALLGDPHGSQSNTLKGAGQSESKVLPGN